MKFLLPIALALLCSSQTVLCDDTEVKNQLEGVFGQLIDLVIQKVDFTKLLTEGVECKDIVMNKVGELLKTSDDDARQCQANIKPAPIDAKQVYESECFQQITSKINTVLTNLVKPETDCLFKKHIAYEAGSIQEILTLAENSITEAVKGVVVIPTSVGAPEAAQAAPEAAQTAPEAAQTAPEATPAAPDAVPTASEPVTVVS